MTLRLFTTQCRPTRTLARSPRMMQSFITMVCGGRGHRAGREGAGQGREPPSLTPLRPPPAPPGPARTLPLRTMFWLPHSTDCRLTLLPDACGDKGRG